MYSEMIRAIGSLWPLGAVVFLAVFVIMFRKPLTGLMERLKDFRIRRGNTELIVTQEAKSTATKEIASPGQSGPLEATPTTKDSDNLLKSETNSTGDWFSRMVAAFISRDIGKLEEAFKGVQDSEVNAVEKLRNNAFYLFLCYRLGDSTALAQLQDLAKRPEVSPFAHHWIGSCYEIAGDLLKAAEAYKDSACSRETEEGRALEIVDMTRCLFKAGNQQEAYSTLMREIAKARVPHARSELYEGLASLYELSQDMELRAFALEKALEARPNDTELRFSTAYSYGERKFDALALLHYETLLSFKPDHALALNNIGVHYDHLEMPISAVRSYKAANVYQNTLASANLAYKYMNGGFKEEALQVLDKAKQQSDAHPNVGSAIAALSLKEKGESERKARSDSSAGEQRRFLLSFAEAYFTETPEYPTFADKWRSADGTEMTITQAETRIAASWGGDKGFTFTGVLSNRAAKVTIYKWGYDLSKSTLGFVEDSQGYAYLSEDSQKLFLMGLKDKEQTFITLERIA